MFAVNIIAGRKRSAASSQGCLIRKYDRADPAATKLHPLRRTPSALRLVVFIERADPVHQAALRIVELILPKLGEAAVRSPSTPAFRSATGFRKARRARQACPPAARPRAGIPRAALLAIATFGP